MTSTAAKKGVTVEDQASWVGELVNIHAQKAFLEAREKDLKILLKGSMTTSDRLEGTVTATGETLVVSKSIRRDIDKDHKGFLAYLRGTDHWAKVVEEKVSVPLLKAVMELNPDVGEHVHYKETDVISIKSPKKDGE